ncbi:MAG TPA: DUF4129 domain-containing protein [Pyrinomonadaceae bacterium]|jgi:hypothetical protein
MSSPDQERQAREHGGPPRPARASRIRSGVALRRVRAMIYAPLLILLFGVAAQTAAAIPLSEYRERIGQATIALDSLNAFDEGVGERERAARIASTLRDVRRAVPPTLAVEWNGAPVEINNSWLDEALKKYEKLRASGAERDEALRSITERLHAIGERLDEVLKGDNAAVKNKDEDKARLNTILRRSEYNRAAEESALARLWARFKRWLRDLFPKRSEEEIEPGQRLPLFTNLAEIIVIGLALAAIAYAGWKLLPRFLQSRGGRKRTKREARVVLGEHLAPDETSSDILAEAEKLARAGDIRGAIRKGYIALLCELGDRKVLRLAQHKTNRDYLRSVSDRLPLYSEMQLLTNSFENHWYGFAPGTENDWAAFRLHYRQALEKQG